MILEFKFFWVAIANVGQKVDISQIVQSVQYCLSAALSSSENPNS
jgi:hypothetical protein